MSFSFLKHWSNLRKLCCVTVCTVPQTQHLTRVAQRRSERRSTQSFLYVGLVSSRSVLEAFLAQSGVNGRVSRGKEQRRCLQAHVLISETVPIKQITGGNTWHDGRQKRIKYLREVTCRAPNLTLYTLLRQIRAKRWAELDTQSKAAAVITVQSMLFLWLVAS